MSTAAFLGVLGVELARGFIWIVFLRRPDQSEQSSDPWANANHKCKCGHPMPLPESYGKYCSECGNQERTLEEVRTIATAAVVRSHVEPRA